MCKLLRLWRFVHHHLGRSRFTFRKNGTVAAATPQRVAKANPDLAR
jgi:hypothetical protein